MNETTSSASTSTTSEAGHVQFRMTVKVDIEGHVPSSDAQSASASATNPTPDLLLKLQPLLPHLCIRQESTKSSETGISAATMSTSMSVGSDDAPAGDDSGLELSLGLSLGSPLFKSRTLPLGAQQGQETQGSVITGLYAQQDPDSQLLRAWHEKGDAFAASGPATSTSFAQLQERGHLGQQQQQQMPTVLQRQPSNAGAAVQPLLRSDSIGGVSGFDWRQRELVLEQQRMKRDAQSQRRQEARKKRRILIDEQKQHRKSAKASAPASSAAMQARVVKPTPQKKGPPAAATENRESSPPAPCNADAGECGGGDGELEDFRNVVRAERDRAILDKRAVATTKTSDCPAASGTGAIRVKVEPEEPESAAAGSGTGGGGGGVIRPSPIHESNHQWVHKFLEMQKMVKCSVATMGTVTVPAAGENAASPRKLEDEDEQKQQGGDGGGELMSKESAASTSTVMDSQSSSLELPVAPPAAAVTASTQMMPPPSSSAEQQVPFQDQSVKQEDANNLPIPASSAASPLFRSVSMGSFGIGDEHSVRMPSPIRSNSQQQSGLLRTLSLDGASQRSGSSAFTSVVAANEQQQSRAMPPPSRPCLVNRTKNSAFKSPKKEVMGGDVKLKPFAVPASTSSANNNSSNNNRMITRRNSTGGGAEARQQDCGGGGQVAAAAPSAASMSSQGFPWVSTTGTGPNGKTVSGVLFAYQKGDVKIVCACHGLHMTAREFVEHAGGVDVANPEKCIKVNPFMLSPSKSMPATTPCTS